MTAEVLVLNRNFYALQVAPWERAMALLFRGAAVAVDEDCRTYAFADWLELSQRIQESPGGFVHTPTLRIAIPEVVALRHFGGVPRREVPFTRRNLYQHYGMRCCYCGGRFAASDINLEHILPRSRGGRSGWDNVVTACVPCNLKKGDRLPQEAGMRLVIRPSRPRWSQRYALVLRSPVAVRRAWQRFIDGAYWDGRLEQA